MNEENNTVENNIPEENIFTSPETEESESVIEENELPRRHFFHAQRDELQFLRDKWILSKISDDNLMDYLKLEQKRSEIMHQEKEAREKRIMTGFVLTVSLAAIVAVVGLLRDNPTILVNILYIAGFLGALWLWRKENDK